MKTLVLCVDRDDDIGRKGNVTSPVIGRKENLRAALALGLADPEDSDTNSILAAVKVYDELIEEGQDAEVATISGDKDVGRTSDKIVAQQYATVHREVQHDGVILVTDGAEDEFILPIISSRAKVISMRRVIVQQEKDIESLIYTIVQGFQNEKILRKVILPMALAMIIFGAFIFLDRWLWAFGGILTMLGAYLLIHSLQLDKPLLRVLDDFKGALENRRYVAAASAVVSIIIFAVGVYWGWNSAGGYEGLKYAYEWTKGSLVFVFAAILVYLLGLAADRYLRNRKLLPSTFIITFMVVAIYFLLMVVVQILPYFAWDDGVEVTQVLLYSGLGFASFIVAMLILAAKSSPSRSSGAWRR